MSIKMCRLCLQTGPSVMTLRSLENSSTDVLNFIKLIQRHIKIELCSKDLSLVGIILCHDCRKVIEAWDKFHKLCVSNDIKYRKILSNVLKSNTDDSKATSIENEEKLEDPLFPNEPSQEFYERSNYIAETDDVPEEGDEKMESLECIGTEHMSAEISTAHNSAPKVKTKTIRGRPKVYAKEKPDMRAGVCTICGEHRKNMYEHMKTHSSDRPYTCPYCSLTFRNASNCKSHINIHTREKTYKCNICDKQYAMRNGLKQHLVTHTKNRDFLCHCGKSFYQRTAFARHTRRHVEKPKVECTECGMLFFSNAEMRYHFRKHAGPAFSCDICGRSFYRKSNLKKHNIIHLKQTCNDGAVSNL